jgi:hypothetical protein
MNIIIKKSIQIFIFSLALFAVSAFSAKAGDDYISVVHENGDAFNSRPMIVENNILPGDFFSRRFIVTKKDGQNQAVMLKFEKTTPPVSHLLAKKIFVRIKRLSDGKFLKMTNGRKRQTLWSLYRYHDSANSDAFKFDTIVGRKGSQTAYEIWFTFSPRAGNAFQNKSTKFNISAGVYSQPSCSCRFGCGKCDLGFWKKCWQWGKRFI